MEQISSEKEAVRAELREKIIAVGLNSLANAWGDQEKTLLNEFVSLSLSEVFPSWQHLNDRVRFQVFSTHIDAFRDYMLERISQEEGGQ
jgi:hypothetical protein